MTKRLKSNGRINSWFGCGVVLFATVFSSGCDRFGFAHLSLPEQAVSLSSKNPEYRSRFTVESDNGEFELDVWFNSTTDGTSHVQVEAIGSKASAVSFEWAEEHLVSAREVSRNPHVKVDCSSAFPCSAQFEAIVTADVASSDEVKGTLSVDVSMNRTNSDYYLAIEPLP